MESRASSVSERRAHLQPRRSTDSAPEEGTSPRVPRKFIANWRHACDRTRDRTKELLKRWRTLPEHEQVALQDDHRGWSVHVWATWVRRELSDDSVDAGDAPQNRLTPTQRDKFAHLFTHLLDGDADGQVQPHDFQVFVERLRHYADWSTNSAEFYILQEVQQGFVSSFLQDTYAASLDQWLDQWGILVHKARHVSDFPVWMQFFAKILFMVINKSNSGVISKNELKDYYFSVLAIDSQVVDKIIDIAYNSMTSNGDHILRYNVFRLSFANYLLGRHPHGPGQFVLGPFEDETQYSIMFPVDYSALNTPPNALEHYSPHKKSNRHSIIV